MRDGGFRDTCQPCNVIDRYSLHGTVSHTGLFTDMQIISAARAETFTGEKTSPF
jgi:hypothetical protein